MGRQKVPKSDFQSQFFYVKNQWNLSGFFSLKNISLEEGFLLLSFLGKFNFRTTLFSKMVPYFVNICESQINYFLAAKLHHLGHTTGTAESVTKYLQ